MGAPCGEPPEMSGLSTTDPQADEAKDGQMTPTPWELGMACATLGNLDTARVEVFQKIDEPGWYIVGRVDGRRVYQAGAEEFVTALCMGEAWWKMQGVVVEGKA